MGMTLMARVLSAEMEPKVPDGNAAFRVIFPRVGRAPAAAPSAMNVESSVELLARVRTGDQDALEQLLRRYVPALRRWARGRLPRWARDLADTEDLVQDTVFRSLKNLNTFDYRHEGALQAYLRQAVMNRIRDECRRVSRRPNISDLHEDLQDDGMSPLEAAVGVQAVDRYETALQHLKPEEREAIVARIEMGYSYAEIALMLAKPSPDAARVAVSRALLRLAERLRNGA
jgi:RNA polymerase sigma factor (sigma-70 family)